MLCNESLIMIHPQDAGSTIMDLLEGATSVSIDCIFRLVFEDQQLQVFWDNHTDLDNCTRTSMPRLSKVGFLFSSYRSHRCENGRFSSVTISELLIRILRSRGSMLLLGAPPKAR